MAYDKYKKIKGRPTKTTPQTGMQNVDKYVDNDDKTKAKIGADGMENIDNYADNDAKTIASRTIQAQSDELELEMRQNNPVEYQHLVSVINCESPETFVDECRAAEQLYHQHHSENLSAGQTANEGYHIINSFRGNVDPYLAHQAGIDLARGIFGDNFAAKICTHTNTDNTHNHIIGNAYRIDGERKFKDEYHLYRKIRRISNEISLQYGMDIIVEGYTDKRDYKEVMAGKEGSAAVKSATWQTKKDIRECESISENVDDFAKNMTDRGYELIRTKNRNTYVKGAFAISDYRLGTRYTVDGIKNSIETQMENEEKRQIARRISVAKRSQPHNVNRPNLGRIYVPYYDNKGRRIPSIIRFLLYIKALIDRIGDLYFDPAAAEIYPDNLRMASAGKKIKTIDKAIKMCEEYDIKTMAGLKEKLQYAGFQAKASDYQAMDLYAVADRIADVAETLKIKEELEMYMTSLGLDASDFPTKTPTADEIRKNYAALDPMSGKQKKQLYNALSDSDYRLKYKGYDSITRTECKKILAFLNGKTEEMPDTLITKEEYAASFAKERLGKAMVQRAGSLKAKYNNIPATDKQIYLIKQRLPKESISKIDITSVTKDMAIRLLNKFSDPPIPKMDEVPAEENKPNNGTIRILNDIVKAYPQETEGWDLDKIDKATANNIINHYLAREDTGLDAIVNPEAKNINLEAKTEHPEEKKRKTIDLKAYPEEQRLCIMEYKKMLDAIADYGLDSEEKIQEFINRRDQFMAEADELALKSRQYNTVYKDLNYLSRTITNISSKACVFGVMYNGPDDDIQEKKEEIEKDERSRLDELRTSLDEAVKELGDTPISNITYDDPWYTPLPPHIRDLIDDLTEQFPGVLHTDKPSTRLSSVEAYDLLASIQNKKVLGERIEELDKEEREKEKKEKTNEKERGLTI